MAAAATRPLPLGDPPPEADTGAERTPRAVWALGAGLLAAMAYAAFTNGAIKVTDGSDVQIGLALLGIGTLAALAAGWGLVARARPGAWIGIGLLVAFGAWCALSISWSISPDESWIEANRAWGYALAAGLAVVLGASLARAPEKTAVAFTGLATVVAAYALGGKVAPAVFDHAGEISRLRAPVGYWNALALFCALAVPLALRLVADERRGHWRIAALGALLVLVSTLALTYSRGGIAVMVLAVIVLVAFGPDRLRVACLSGIVVVGVVPGLLVAFLRDDLTTDELASSARTDDGLLLFVALLIGFVIALVLASMVWQAGASLRFSPKASALLPRVAAGIGAGLALVLVVLAATGWLGDRLEGFTEPRAERVTDPTRIVATTSGNRWVWWKEAAGATWDQPLVGYGAGSFPLVHLQYRKERLDVRQPHSVPLEFLSETGIVGAALVIGALALLGGAAVGRVRGAVGADRAYAAALLAACAAYAVHVWVDWDWDIPAVTLPVMIFLGVLAARPPGTVEDPLARSRPRLAPLIVGGILLALFAVSAALPALAREESDAALAQAAQGGTANLREADEKAATARRLDPFAIDPVFTSADLARRRGDVERAAEVYADAVREQPNNPRLWLGLARLQAQLDDVSGSLASARRAFELDPFARTNFGFSSLISYDTSRSATATGTPLPERLPVPALPSAPAAPQGSTPDTFQAPASPPSAPAPSTPSP